MTELQAVEQELFSTGILSPQRATMLLIRLLVLRGDYWLTAVELK